MAKKKEKDIIENIVNTNIRLNKVNAEKFPDVSADTDINVRTKEIFKYEIVSVENNIAVIKLISQIGFDPQIFFNIELELIGEFYFKEAITKEKVEKNIKSILNFMANRVSFIVSFITREILDQPYIIPPIVEKVSNE
ncbi:hypothetical protein VTU32_06465 [Thermoanaerobacter sp. CM-CNRG TB177]|jgi:hypothetical protein|uniref:hypothetical protein n=1 Tax=Thermoanaerobacter sp. CM-CNRG TB177 TaxID=2800659 RepID=UPI001BDF41F2|nr:hypothetical protein [Thermoanaerobacter sp. CM-CNRG TB177]MBT1278940.1 hypothetical protein [Thermoanaerobacter sp. CM-CNRG TB177]